jgi:hypothetical protein
VQQVARPLGEHARLARPGRGDDAGGAPRMGDGGQLVGSQLGGGVVGAVGAQRAVLDRVAVHDRESRPRPDRSTVAPGGRAVGEHDVGVGTGGCAPRHGSSRPPPGRGAVVGAPVGGVGPHRVVPPLAPQREPRTQLPGGGIDPLGRRLVGIVEPEARRQLDDERGALAPCRFQPIEDVVVVEGGDGDALAALPRRGRGPARRHDDRPAEQADRARPPGHGREDGRPLIPAALVIGREQPVVVERQRVGGRGHTRAPPHLLDGRVGAPAMTAADRHAGHPTQGV